MSGSAPGPLEPIEPQHAEEYHRLLRSAYAQNLELGVHFGASDASLEDVRRHLRENIAYGLRDEHGALISTVSLRMPWGPNPGYLGLPHVGWLATDPGHGGRGLARTVLEAVTTEIVERLLHAPALSLGTARNHPWLGSYYQRLGFQPVGSRDLGLGHITDFYLRPIDEIAYAGWRERHADLLKGLTP